MQGALVGGIVQEKESFHPVEKQTPSHKQATTNATLHVYKTETISVERIVELLESYYCNQ